MAVRRPFYSWVLYWMNIVREIMFRWNTSQ